MKKKRSIILSVFLTILVCINVYAWNSPVIDSDYIAQGKVIYDKSCAGCHGSDGKGSTPVVGCGTCDTLESLADFNLGHY
jgi:cytochrome c553